MRLSHLIPGVIIATSPLLAQQTGTPATSPDQLRQSVREWIETMREIQKEEDSWEKDREVLQAYKEGLQKEIETLREQIARAKTEREGAEKEDLDKIARRDSYEKAKTTLASSVREMEQSLVARLSLLPAPLLAAPKDAQMVDELKKDAQLSGDRANDGIAKRLNNALNLISEAEKFQTTVVLRDELHKAPDGREFNMKVVYFGLANAYAVNEGGDFALVGSATPSGWSFTERNDLAPKIKQLVGVTTGDLDAAFVTLPIDLP